MILAYGRFLLEVRDLCTRRLVSDLGEVWNYAHVVHTGELVLHPAVMNDYLSTPVNYRVRHRVRSTVAAQYRQQSLQPCARWFIAREGLLVQIAVGLAIESLVHESTEVVVVQNNRRGKTPRQLIYGPVKTAVISQMVNNLIVAMAPLWKLRHRIDTKALL